jgi:hypothetical protein
MKTVTAGRKLTLDRQHLVKMLVDPTFYSSCPYFMWLRRTAMKTFAIYQESAARNDCRACGHDFRIMQPIVDAFFTNLKELHDDDPETIACVRQYLEVKKGCKIARVTIMYRASRKEPHPQKLRFQF